MKKTNKDRKDTHQLVSIKRKKDLHGDKAPHKVDALTLTRHMKALEEIGQGKTPGTYFILKTLKEGNKSGTDLTSFGHGVNKRHVLAAIFIALHADPHDLSEAYLLTRLVENQ